MCDYDPPSAFWARDRKARTAHVCYECDRPIERGTVYRYVSGVWDGRGSSFKFCQPCWALHEDYRAGDEDDCGAAYGQLGQAIMDGGDEDLVRRWQEIRGEAAA